MADDDFATSFDRLLDLGSREPQPAGNDFAKSYDTFLDDMQEIGRRNAKLNLFGARDVNPDTAARAQDLARQTGLPPETVERNIPEVEQQVRAARQDKILRESPALVQWLQDGANARVAHDDFEKLGFFEKTWQTMSRGWTDTQAGNERGRLGYASMVTGGAPEYDKRLDELDKQLREPQGGENDLFQRAVRATSGLLGGFADQLTSEPVIASMALGTAIGAVSGGGVADVVTVPVGATAGFIGGMVADGFRVGAGQTWLALKAMRDADGRPIDHNVAVGASIVGGLLVGVLNAVGVKQGGQPLVQAGQALIRRAVEDAVKAPTARAALGQLGIGIAKSTATGAGFGALNEGTMIAVEQTARLVSDGSFTTVLDDPAEQKAAADWLMHSIVDMALSFGVLGTAGHGISLVANLARARQAARDATFLEDLNGAASDSATRQRAPDAFARFVQEQANGSPVETLYIPATKMRDLYRRLGLDPFAITDDADPVFGFLPDRRQQLELGLAIGGDVAVPLAQYISRLAGTDLHTALKEDIRVRPDGMTLHEAREIQEHYAEALAARGGELRAAAAAAAEKSQSALAVFGDALEKLRTVGSPLDVARQTAMLMSARYDAMGTMLGTDALTEYRRSNIEWQQILSEGLPQDTADSPSVAGAKGYEQRDKGKLRGSVRFEDGRTIISLFEQRNLSTVFHELGHVWLEELVAAVQRPEAPQQLRDAMAATLKWFGVKDASEITKEHHEQWARGFEAYAMEGKAPTAELGGAFQLFKSWLLSIYGTVEALKTPINDEIRAVFDRMLATDAAIAEAQGRLHGRAPALAEWPRMMEARYKAYAEHVARSGEVAWRQVQGKAISDLRRRATPEWKAEEETLRKELRSAIDSQPDIVALHYLRGDPLPDSLAHLRDRPRLKLLREALIEEHGDPAIVTALPRSFQSMVTKKGGARPSEIAKLLGFADGRSMIDALAALAREQAALRRAGDQRSVRAKRIDDAVERVMVERHGPALIDGSIDAEAKSALHNEAGARALAAEEQALAHKVGREPMSYKQAMELARGLLAEEPAGRIIGLSRFALAEERAASASLEARVRGDFDAAHSRKREQMVARAAWRVAHDVNQRVAAAQRRVDRRAAARMSEAVSDGGKLATSNEVGISRSAASSEGGPGVWRTVKEGMKPRAAAYQRQITGEIGKAYFVNSVKFDGYSEGTLLEVKGPGYAHLLKEGPLKNGQPRKKLRTRDNWIAQMQRQKEVANGVPIHSSTGWFMCQEQSGRCRSPLASNR